MFVSLGALGKLDGQAESAGDEAVRDTSAGDGCAKQGAGLRSRRAAQAADREPRPHPQAELELAPGSSRSTGETGAGRRSSPRRSACCSARTRDLCRRGGTGRRTSRRSSTFPTGSSTRTSRRSATCARRTRPVSSSRGGSRRTGARARSPGGARSPARRRRCDRPPARAVRAVRAAPIDPPAYRSTCSAYLGPEQGVRRTGGFWRH